MNHIKDELSKSLTSVKNSIARLKNSLDPNDKKKLEGLITKKLIIQQAINDKYLDKYSL